MKRTPSTIGLAALAAVGAIVVGGGAGPAAAAPVTVSYVATGGPQTFVVPAGVTSVDFELCGAQGGTVGVSAGGRGTRIDGTLAVTPGETLVLEVGGLASGQTGGYNGGGDGPQGRQGFGIGGGGATDIRRGGGALADRIRVAAGGGGGGYTVGTLSGNSGGAGGDQTGWDGSQAQGGGAGLGGTQSAGGAGGVDGTSAGAPGTLGQGGAGNGSGSGGGGGYYGGGGGAGEVVIGTNNGGGGGGGSSLADPSDTVEADGCDGVGTAVLTYDVQTTTSSTTTTSTTTPGSVTTPGGSSGPSATPAAPVRGRGSYTG